ncbi:hypothetical protein CMV_019140 [Castanea mollissima]|uniref:Uncharacterized protein n=1 Tax=Castanea mollissima TaxID=60419 RepID=A0A8J4VNZ6_9ROSI|nr:hypothetical protein CMV_019140 [Castanea mollissima]
MLARSLSLSLSHTLSPAGLRALCSPENTEHLSRSPSLPLFPELRPLAVNLRRSPVAGKSDLIGLEFAVKFNFLEGRTRIWFPSENSGWNLNLRARARRIRSISYC